MRGGAAIASYQHGSRTGWIINIPAIREGSDCGADEWTRLLARKSLANRLEQVGFFFSLSNCVTQIYYGLWINNHTLGGFRARSSQGP
jgi:hypothetical protein